ncbi:MAG: hypothetical protein K2Z81_03555, partial [Cyanobacteria bacterium]|nr:hypothetical protein [Cyanobacteriota bacterium]
AYSRGIECQLNHQFKQAGKHFRNALPLAGTSSVCKAVCTDILVRLGDIANATEQQLSARYYYQQAAEQIGDKADKRCAGLQFKLGQSFLSDGKVIDAKRHLEKALSLISVSNEEELRISCLASLSSCALASEQFDEACNYMDELLAVLRDDSCKHQSLKKLLLRRLVEMNVDNGDKSITYLRRLLSVTDQDKDFPDSQTLDCATRLAERYLWSDRADQARKVLYEIKKVLSSGPRENSRSAELLRMAMVSLRLGQAEERLHHPDEAEKLFAVAYEQARKTLPAGSRRLWPFLEILAARHLVNGRADSNSLVKARQDYQAILELNTRYKWNLSHAQLYSVNFNLAAILERTHNTDGAIIFFKEALGHASYCQSCFFSKASWRIASIYLEQKNIAAARRYVDAALRTECGRNHNDQRRASLLALSGTIAMWEERFERARSDLESARKIYARIGADESVVSGLCNQLNDTRLKQPR